MVSFSFLMSNAGHEGLLLEHLNLKEMNIMHCLYRGRAISWSSDTYKYHLQHADTNINLQHINSSLLHLLKLISTPWQIFKLPR